MTRVDQAASSPQTPPSAKSSASSEHDFADYLGADRTSAHRQEGEPNARASAVDGKAAVATRLLPDNVRASSQPPASQAIAPDERSPQKTCTVPVMGVLPAHATPWKGEALLLMEGVTTARVFEQHWYANGYLSFIRDAAHEAGHAALGAEAVSTPASRPVRSSTVGPAESQGALHTGSDVDEKVPWPVLLDDATGMAGGTPRSAERLARAFGPVPIADQPWPERLLRLIAKPNGRATVWVRDYALPAPARAALVTHLRGQAAREGIVLERIVINGTTVWRSDSTLGEA